ncbi:unnamed protein product [Adineta steineri]|uniref:Uncharacterized protein n=1 Tax=Adineta steineri TaxID=433720 RepID=A0A814QR86_9BILA|nr:unnamed protein product [Adineta steineri]CAF1123770.1 unnamed protein product [Adineta steineri]
MSNYETGFMKKLKKNYIRRNSQDLNNIVTNQTSENLITPVYQPIEEVSTKLDIEEQPQSIETLMTPVAQPKQDTSNKLDVEQQSKNKIMLQSN